MEIGVRVLPKFLKILQIEIELLHLHLPVINLNLGCLDQLFQLQALTLY